MFIQIDYAPKHVNTGHHSAIKEANNVIKEMNASISRYKSPYVSIQSKLIMSCRKHYHCQET